eukprot:gene28427-37525_t
MVGDGDDLPRYHAQVERLGIQGNVRFLPPMPAREAFALAALVVVPSRAEAMPYIVLETLAAARPMIATSVGGIPEIFGSDSPALIRPDAVELAGKMTEAMADIAAYSKLMPDAASLRARFGADVMAAEIEKAYFAALDNSLLLFRQGKLADSPMNEIDPAHRFSPEAVRKFETPTEADLGGDEAAMATGAGIDQVALLDVEAGKHRDI